MTEEIYPMPFFVSLTVDELEASSKFYQEALGFKHIFTMPGLAVSRRLSTCDGVSMPICYWLPREMASQFPNPEVPAFP